MHFIRITSSNDPMYHSAMELYGQCFPSHEQRSEKSQQEIINHEDYHFNLIYDETLFVGCVLYWETEEFIYVEHYYISPKLRNQKYGQRALEELKKQNKTIILEIDPIVDDISKRRKGFYERVGFKANPFPHIHPPYHKENHGHELIIMSCPKEISEALYQRFNTYLKKTVMYRHLNFGETRMNYNIRKMTIDDYKAVFDLWMNSPNMGLRSLDDSKEGIAMFLRRNPETCFVAIDGKTVTGVILCGHDGRRGYIYHTVVQPNYRKQGIGTALINAAVAALQKEGITRVCLNVMESNEEGKRFWTNRGWEKKDFLGFFSKSITEKENLPLFKV